ncbi:MAG: rhodanese-like domain-containing protein [Acidobacteria bacterium]|nr:rhodanese-like domain-containing protein [Acidobacteriota bacterium]MBI3487279.1 rhodanese-like domain-containing protein [Acidobacteriota bacterium]
MLAVKAVSILHALSEYWIYLLPLGAVGYLLWSRRSASPSDVKALLERGAQIVDVRTKAEFQAAAHPRAVNLPLDQLQERLEELDRSRPVLCCCESGARSGSAVALLKRSGFAEVANLGSWRRIASLLP